jgi:hypothetical protein
MSNQPLSEQFRLAAKDWVDKDAAASMLEETKTAVLAQRMGALGDIPVNRAEQIVKGSKEWHDWIAGMVKARTQANLEKVKLEWIRMRFSEQQSGEATKRAEMKL